MGRGDGFVTLPDPTDSNVIYYEHQNGDMRRKPMDGPIWSGAGPNEKFVQPKSKKGEPRLRFSWNTPLVISHHNPLTFYCGANKVFKSLNRGDDWVCISPDLTPGQRGRISTLSESPLKIGLIYVGMGRGNVQVPLNEE